MTTKAKPKNPVEPTAEATEALNLRDQFALAALPGIIASFHPLPNDAFEISALAAYRYADALLEARSNAAQLTARVKKNREAGTRPDG